MSVEKIKFVERMVEPEGVLVLGQEDYDALLFLAANSPRKRAIRVLHEPWEHANKMINAILPESYVRPHKHKDPHTSDTMTALRGVFDVVVFNDEGEIKDVIPVYGNRVVNIPPGTWHIVVSDVPFVLFEVKGQPEGGYRKKSDKLFAPWSPEGGTPEEKIYLEELKQRISERN